MALAASLCAVAITASRAIVPAARVEVVTAPPHRIDLSTAPADELALLPEVGPRLAARIAADRAVRGRFASADELARVPGVGAGTIEALRDAARVGDR